jgi:3' terminal RNA ribose 2'-O-methyltransferase Hen1
MLLTISTTHQPATHLGFLLHKHPENRHEVELSFGKAYVFYPEANEERCTAALLLDVDPVGLVRNRKGPSGDGGLLDQYVNDRPYAASSFLSVAIARTFGTALSGRSKHRQELVEAKLPFEANLPAVPCRGGEEMLRALFEPLGYALDIVRLPLDEKFPSWGESRYFDVTLRGNVTLHDLLSHLYVLIPVLDADKHYWVGDDEVEKLLRHGEGWLATHPAKGMVTRRYLRHRPSLVRQALERLVGDETPEVEEKQVQHAAEEEKLEERISLNEQRLRSVIAAVHELGAKSVVDVGCGDGKLLRALMQEKSIERIVGMDVSIRALEIAADRLHFDRMPPKQRARIELIHGSLMYRDARLSGFDVLTAIEVIEHLDLARLTAFERTIFTATQPANAIITTPNVEYNVKFETLPAGKMRHKDHRFEWTRAEFQQWGDRIASAYGYSVTYSGIGEADEVLGAPTQMAVFSKRQFLGEAVPR